jgi:hypothetical protein
MSEHSLEELRDIVRRIEQRLETCKETERAELERVHKAWMQELVAKQESLIGKLEAVVHDPRFSGSAPPLMKRSKLHEFIVGVLQRLGFKRSK